MASGTDSPLIPDLGPDVYVEWRGSEIGAITEHLQRRLVLGLLGDFGVAGFSMWVAVMVISRSNCGVEALS